MSVHARFTPVHGAGILWFPGAARRAEIAWLRNRLGPIIKSKFAGEQV
jgi:hypothetical protein